jgi:hypothetical protein
MIDGIYKRDNNEVYGLKDNRILFVLDDIEEFELQFLTHSKFRKMVIKELYKDGYINQMVERYNRTFGDKKRTDVINEDYERYIKSKDWQCKRYQKLEEIDYCEECGSTKNLHVHHLTYDNFMDEPMEDLQVLCKECHMKVHGRKF